MKQGGLNAPVFVKQPQLTKRQKFLQAMERVVPWALWVTKIAPHYPVAGRRRPFPLETMLRIHLMQQRFGHSDPAMEEARHDVPMRREFAGLDAAEDATTILKFRRLLESHALAQALFDGTAALLAEKGLLRQGTIVDATLIAAPPSTKNRDRPRDPERSSTKKGSHYDFGLKAHIGVDADSGLVHTVEVTTAKVADGVMTGVLLHGEETVVLGDRAYTRNDRNLAAEREGHDPVWAFPFQRKPGEAARPAEQALLNRRRAPPCRLVKRPFGHVTVRYRGLSRNAQQRYRGSRSATSTRRGGRCWRPRDRSALGPGSQRRRRAGQALSRGQTRRKDGPSGRASLAALPQRPKLPTYSELP